jgi:N-methylhydantoinase A
MTHDFGVDVVGTFTDAIVSDEDTHELTTEMVLTTPEALSADVPDDGEVESEVTGARRAEPPDVRASRPVIDR